MPKQKKQSTPSSAINDILQNGTAKEKLSLFFFDVSMDDAVTDIVVMSRSICSEVADELEGQDYEHATLVVVRDQIDRLRALADDLTEPRL